MSSIPNPVTRPQRPAGAPVRQTTEDVRQALHQHLRKTASFIKFMDALVLLFAWLAGMLLIWLAACAVDHWIWPLASWGRWLFWAIGLAASGWWLGWHLLPLLVRRINPVYAARRIEHLVPEFKNGLISWLELETLPEHGVPRGVMAALAFRASRFIGGQDPSATVDTSPLIKIIGCVLLLSTGLVLYTMLSPKSTFVTAQRIMFPWTSLAPPTRVQIMEVQPGAVELTQGRPLEVVVAARGLRRDEQVTVRYSTVDGQLENQRTTLTATTQGFRYAGRVTTDSQGVQQPLDYWIEAGDALSGPFRVRLSPLPSVVLQSVELQYPAYTQLKPRTVSGDKIEAVEGTRAVIQAQSNQSLSRGRLEINPTLDEAGELVQAQAFIDMEILQRQVRAALTLELDDAGSNPTQLEYRIRGYNQRGDANPRPITHALSVLADMPPEVTLVGPESRVLRVRANSRINVEVRASDPDFGLTRLSLTPSRNGVPAADIMLLQSAGIRGRQVKTYSIELANSRATVGERFELVATAADNRHDPRSQQPAPNITRSQPLVLQIVGPEETADVPDSSSAAAAGGADQPPHNQPGAPGAASSPPEQQPSQSNPSMDNAPGASPAGAARPEPGNKSSSEPGQEPEAGVASENQSSENQSSENQQPGSEASGGGGSQAEQKSGGEGQPQPGGSGASSSGQGGAESQPSSDSGETSRGGAGQSSSASNSASQKNGSGASGGSSSSSASGESTGEGTATGSGAASSDAGAGSESSSGSQPPGSPGSPGGKPGSDAEAFQRVSEYLQSQPPQADGSPSGGQPQPPGDNSQSRDSQSRDSQSRDSQSNGAGSNSSPANGSPPGNSAADKPAESPKRGAQPGDSSSASSNSQSRPSSAATGGEGQKPEAKGADGPGVEEPGADGKSSDAKASEGQGAEGKGSEGQGSEGQGAEAKGPEGKGSEGQGADGQGADGKDTTGQGADGQSKDRQGSDGKDAFGQGSDGKGAPGQGAEGKGANGQGADGKDANGQGAEGKGADGKGADGKGADGKGADGKGADGKAGQGADGKGAAGKNAAGQGAEGKDSAGKGAQGEKSGGADAAGESSPAAPDSVNAPSQSQPSGSQPSGAKDNGSKDTPQRTAEGQASPPAASPPAASPPAGSQPSGAQSSGAQSSGAQGTAADSSSNKSSKSTGGGSSPAPGGGSGTGTQGGEGGGSGQSDASNREYADKTTQMVLDYLNRQKDQPDPDLLRELDWTPQDMQRFVERWNRARDLADSANPAERNKWAQMLEDLNLLPADQQVRQGSDRNDAFQQQRDSGGRMRVPASLQKQFDAYRQAIEQAR